MTREWTDQEKEFAVRHFGRMKIHKMAERLGRPQAAVLKKMYRLGLTRTHAQCKYTVSDLANYLKVSPTTIKRWIQIGLKYNKVSCLKIIYNISIENLQLFFNACPEAYDYKAAPKDSKELFEFHLLPDPPTFKRMFCPAEHHIITAFPNRSPVKRSGPFYFWAYLYTDNAYCPLCGRNLGRYGIGKYINYIRSWEQRILK